MEQTRHKMEIRKYFKLIKKQYIKTNGIQVKQHIGRPYSLIHVLEMKSYQ